MSKQDRQKLSILIVLLGVLGLTVVLGYRMNQPATTAAVQTPETKTSVNPPALGDAGIRLDLLDRPENGEDIGKKNPFEYRQAPPPPPATQGRGTSVAASQPNAFGRAPLTSPPPVNPQPPGPPPIPLKYSGYLASDTPGGGFTAVLSDDQRHYNVTVGEVLMGRYRVLSISDKIVDVEDIEYKRRQSLPIVK